MYVAPTPPRTTAVTPRLHGISLHAKGVRARSRAVLEADGPAAGPRRALDLLFGEPVPPGASVARGAEAETDHHAF